MEVNMQYIHSVTVSVHRWQG